MFSADYERDLRWFFDPSNRCRTKQDQRRKTRIAQRFIGKQIKKVLATFYTPSPLSPLLNVAAQGDIAFDAYSVHVDRLDDAARREYLMLDADARWSRFPQWLADLEAKCRTTAASDSDQRTLARILHDARSRLAHAQTSYAHDIGFRCQVFPPPNRRKGRPKEIRYFDMATLKARLHEWCVLPDDTEGLRSQLNGAGSLRSQIAAVILQRGTTVDRALVWRAAKLSLMLGGIDALSPEILPSTVGSVVSREKEAMRRALERVSEKSRPVSESVSSSVTAR